MIGFCVTLTRDCTKGQAVWYARLLADVQTYIVSLANYADIDTTYDQWILIR
jgi:hypothetical protein